MIKRLRNSLLFCYATIVSAVVSVMALALISLKERFRVETHVRSRSAVFLADKMRTVAFYRIFSRVYDSVNGYFYSDVMREEVSRLANVSSDARVLDVGCGTGYTTEVVLRHLHKGEAVGVDLTPQQLKKAARNLRFDKTRLSLCRGDVESLPFRDETFDSVVSVGAIEYFPNPREALKEMARVVKTGGRVIVGGPELDWFKKTHLNRILYTPSAGEVEGFFNEAKLRNVRSVLTGVDTFFATNKYVVIVTGTK